jgi:multimeric flavodoxin WrbA
MKKIVCVLGSPRPAGNSTAIARRFCESAARHGAEVRSFALNTLEYRGCQGCMACKTRLDRCVLDDGLTPVLEAVRGADVVLLASPIYYGDVSSQMKGFIDRTFSYLVADYTTNPVPHRLRAGKTLVFALAQGGEDESSFADVFPRYADFFEWFGFTQRHLLRACAVRNLGDVDERKDVLRLAEETAERVCGA